jgi:hypothetical protein
MNRIFVFFNFSIIGALTFIPLPGVAHPSTVATMNDVQEKSSVHPHLECPTDLSRLQPEMENVLSSIHDAQNFKHTIRQSLTHSIPDAIAKADGLKDQVAYLQKEITHQNQVIRETQQIAERHSPSDEKHALAPCPPEQKGSYCSAVEQYYMAKATNLANEGFLEGLLCYQRKGFR